MASSTSELTNCPRTAAVLGELAAQWQQMMVTSSELNRKQCRATEAWTDGRYAEDHKHVELDNELAVTSANVTEGAARATVLKVTQTGRVTGSWHGKHWLTAAPKSSNDPAMAPQTILATPQEMQGCEGAE